jgi:hypothetical protein
MLQTCYDSIIMCADWDIYGSVGPVNLLPPVKVKQEVVAWLESLWDVRKVSG